MVKIVKIKTWEEMKEEFTYYAGDGLLVNGVYFSKEMEKELPQDRIIEITFDKSWGEWFWETDEKYYYITEGLIKEEITEDKEVIVPNPTNSTNPTNPTKLSEFLKENNCYEAFGKYFNKDEYQYWKGNTSEDPVFAFNFENTIEGEDYWRNIYEKWSKIKYKENDMKLFFHICIIHIVYLK